MANADSSTFADSRAYDLRPSNSSKRQVETGDQGVRFDREASYYDMSGDKFLIILNQFSFKKTKHFKKRPSTRYGTFKDERRLKEVFYRLGFHIFGLRDLEYQNIIDYLTAIASLDHTRTSCICVTILTHGDKGGKVYAADKPYLLSEVMAIFGNVTSLTNKPKLFFVQACRGGSMDAGHTVYLGSQSDSFLTVPSYYSSEMPAHYPCPEEQMFMMPPGHADSQYLGCGLIDLFKICGDFWMDDGNTDRTDSPSVSFITVPTHADTLVLCSTVEDFLSYRDKDGSWMIQALCDTIQNHHEDLNLLDIIIQVNRTVAYERVTRRCLWKPMDNKKQMPETRFTLTKHLRF